jgi:pyruvate ferredoxin oxidoreductase delta subunit
VIKRVEINYRGVFQKTLARKLGSDIVRIAARMGKVGFSNGRYSDAPERNGIPCKYFAFISPDLSEEELEAECGAKMDIDEADISIVLDDTMVKGVEPWAWSGIRPINEKVAEGGFMLVISNKEASDLLTFIPKKGYPYNLAILPGEGTMSGLWVYNDDLTHERVLGAIAGLDPDLLSIDAVEQYLRARTAGGRAGEPRAAAAVEGYESVQHRYKVVTPEEGTGWSHAVPVLPKWSEFREGVAIPAIKRGFAIGPHGQSRSTTFRRGTSKSSRPAIRFDLCSKCTMCWLECPDECFDPTPDGLYDVDYQYCVGCGKCADVCPIRECIVMVDELQFEDDSSAWEFWTRDPQGYIDWVEQRKGATRRKPPIVTGTGPAVVLQGQQVPEGQRARANRDQEVSR